MSQSDIRRKIAALLRLTKDAGCSEAEAMAAAQKAAALLSEYGLCEADVVMSRIGVRAKTKGRGARDRLWGTVALCTNTAMIYDQADRGTGDVIFVGQEPGPEIASYLYKVLNRAFDNEIEAFKLTSNYRRRKAVNSRRAAVHDFTFGMVLRVAPRIREMFVATVSESQRQSAEAALAQFYPNTIVIKRPDRHQRLQPSALGEGLKAGGRVNLAHGVNGSQAVEKIGKAP